jgi:hypothetical protein
VSQRIPQAAKRGQQMERRAREDVAAAAAPLILTRSSIYDVVARVSTKISMQVKRFPVYNKLFRLCSFAVTVTVIRCVF